MTKLPKVWFTLQFVHRQRWRADKNSSRFGKTKERWEKKRKRLDKELWGAEALNTVQKGAKGARGIRNTIQKKGQKGQRHQKKFYTVKHCGASAKQTIVLVGLVTHFLEAR